MWVNPVLVGTARSLLLVEECQISEGLKLESDCVVNYYDVDELLSKDSFFIASFELGRTFAVSGDTPTSPAVTLVLFIGPLLCMCLKEEWARSLNAFKSADAFSKYCIRRVHMWQT